MTDITAGNTSTFTLAAGQELYVKTTGTAVIKYGRDVESAPSVVSLSSSDGELRYGPLAVPMLFTVTSTTGTATYANEASQIKQLPDDGSEMVATVNAIADAVYVKTGGMSPSEFGEAVRNGQVKTSISALQALTGMTNGQSAFLSLGGRSGLFLWDGSDLSTEVAADTLQGVYIAPASDVTGASGAWVRKLNGYVTPEMFGGSLQHAILSRNKVIGDAVLSSSFTIPVTDGDSYHVDLTSISGIGTVSFLASEEAAEAVNNVSRSDKTITFTSINPVIAGDTIIISGTVGHELYSPSRYTTAKIVATVTGVSGLIATLDQQIDYILTSVTAAKIPDASVTFKCESQTSVSVVTENVKNVTIKTSSYGDIGVDNNSSFVSVSSAEAANVSVAVDNAACVFGVVLNNISSGECRISSVNSGGLSSGTTSKMFRANGIRNMTIYENHVSARHADHVIEGARNCVIHAVSYGGGANFFDSGSTANNRLESYSNNECDNVTLYGNVRESNDQCLELLSCVDCKAYGHWENGKNTTSSEGAVVIKGFSHNTKFHGVAIGHSSRGLKVECLNGATNCGTGQTAYIESDSTDAISVRDASSAYDTGHSFYGTVKPFNANGIDIRANSDGVFVNVVADMGDSTGYGVFCAAQGSSCSVRGVNTSANKRLIGYSSVVTSMSVGVVDGDSDDVIVNYNSTSADYFKMSHANNVSGVIHFNGFVQFYKRGGMIYSNSVPTQGIYSAGDIYHRFAYNSPAVDDVLFGVTMRQVEVGRVYDGASWIQSFALRAV